MRDCEEFQTYSEAHAVVCRCQKALQAWEHANDGATKHQLRQAYGAALEALFQLLKTDLSSMVHEWILGCVSPAIPASQEQQIVIQEVEDHMALNIFTPIVRALSKLALDAKTDVRGELLIIARRSLYNCG